MSVRARRCREHDCHQPRRGRVAARPVLATGAFVTVIDAASTPWSPAPLASPPSSAWTLLRPCLPCQPLSFLRRLCRSRRRRKRCFCPRCHRRRRRCTHWHKPVVHGRLGMAASMHGNALCLRQPRNRGLEELIQRLAYSRHAVSHGRCLIFNTPLSTQSCLAWLRTCCNIGAEWMHVQLGFFLVRMMCSLDNAHTSPETWIHRMGVCVAIEIFILSWRSTEPPASANCGHALGLALFSSAHAKKEMNSKVGPITTTISVDTTVGQALRGRRGNNETSLH